MVKANPPRARVNPAMVKASPEKVKVNPATAKASPATVTATRMANSTTMISKIN